MKNTLLETRAARGLAPYQSPKKAWDDLGIVPTTEVLVEKDPSSRAARRARGRDLDAMGRKSRRKSDKVRFQQRQAEATYRGLGRIYFGLSKVAYPLQVNAVRQVEDIAEQRSQATGTPYTTALKETEERLSEILVSYGDIEEAVA